MNLVVDANVLLSALIRDSTTRRLLLNDNFILCAPEFVLKEFLEHIEELEEKTEVNGFVLKDKIDELILLSNIKIIPQEEFSDFIEEANEISPDPDDVMYFALALKLKCPIWSNDKRLKQQNKVEIYSTEDLMKFLEQD